MKAETKLYKFNNAIYYDQVIQDFSYNHEIKAICSYLYDTHLAKIHILDEKESVLFEHNNLFLKSGVLNKKELYNRLGKTFANKLIQSEILLGQTRQVILGKRKNVVVWLQSNHSCNLACPGCSTGMDVKQDVSHKMEKKVLEKCLRKVIVDAHEKGYERIELRIGGGEPTLRGKNWLEDVGATVRLLENEFKTKISITLLSNGILLSPLLEETIKKYKIWLVVSTDPSRVFPKSNISTINLVLKNIEYYKKNNHDINAQLTIGAHNAKAVVELHKKLTEMGIRITWALFRPSTKDQYNANCGVIEIKKALSKIYQYTYARIMKNEFYGNITEFDYLGMGVVKDRVCGAGKSYVVLDYNGDVYTCTEKIGGKTENLLTTTKNTFEIISEIHEVPSQYRNTSCINYNYDFMWQGGMGCPWVIEKEKGKFNTYSDYMTNIYSFVAPRLISLNVLASSKNFVTKNI